MGFRAYSMLWGLVHWCVGMLDAGKRFGIRVYGAMYLDASWGYCRNLIKKPWGPLLGFYKGSFKGCYKGSIRVLGGLI